MKKVAVFLVIAGLTTMFASGQKKETRQVSGFTGIDASSVFNITVTKGAAESLAIEADDAIMQYVRSEVKNGVLRLYIEKDAEKKVGNIKTLKATVVMKELDKVSLSGACKLTADDLFTSDSFKGDCSGASALSVNVNTGRLKIDASGASNIRINANVNGNADIDLSGASKLQAEMKANSVKFDSSGVSTIDLSGSATDVKIDMSGTSKFQAVDFKVKNANIKSSGTGNVTISVTDELNVSSSGASSINYKGSPVIKFNTSGTSKIRSI